MLLPLERSSTDNCVWVLRRPNLNVRCKLKHSLLALALW